ncbi:hypothetical protein [Streptosporangium subroseum]|uniref:hypothetical protein n=1 Tax=Streptosporangium subroseum TaxID=106412 RepID=UPI003085CE28|nr:hypothetical protein OHB15_27690 [Streptosporangium subroseum]
MDVLTVSAVPAYPAAEIAAAWQRERPGTPTESIEIVTPIWRLAKLFADDRGRVLRSAGIDAATLDLLSVIRRSGPPYALSHRSGAEAKDQAQALRSSAPRRGTERILVPSTGSCS